MTIPHRFPYTARWKSILLGTLFFGGGGIMMGLEASRNEAALTINGIIRLEPRGATVFYWVICGLSAGFVLVSALSAINRLLNPKTLEFDTDSMVLPHGFLQNTTTRVHYADIREISESSVQGQRFLTLKTTTKKFTIAAALLPDAAGYETIRNFLQAKVAVEAHRKLGIP